MAPLCPSLTFYLPLLLLFSSLQISSPFALTLQRGSSKSHSPLRATGKLLSKDPEYRRSVLSNEGEEGRRGEVEGWKAGAKDVCLELLTASAMPNISLSLAFAPLPGLPSALPPPLKVITSPFPVPRV